MGNGWPPEAVAQQRKYSARLIARRDVAGEREFFASAVDTNWVATRMVFPWTALPVGQKCRRGFFMAFDHLVRKPLDLLFDNLVVTSEIFFASTRLCVGWRWSSFHEGLWCRLNKPEFFMANPPSRSFGYAFG
jgi:hypothetical protein